MDLLRLKQTSLPFLFNLTIDPKSIVKDFVYEEIRVFNSKKVPLMLTCLNAQPGGGATQCLFKNGDDLRQDILTL
jgi:phosphatidylinositol kinase/protein kinase (PI-3  family)